MKESCTYKRKSNKRNSWEAMTKPNWVTIRDLDGFWLPTTIMSDFPLESVF